MKITTGMPSLDKLLGGGFPSNTTILLSGKPGTGKTLMGLNFLIEGAAKGEKCYFLSISETKEELLRACDEIKSLKSAKEYIDKNLLIESFAIGRRINLEYFTKLFSEYPKIDRLVIDNVNKLLIASENNKEYRVRMAEIFRYLREKVGCSVILCETKENLIDTGNGESFDCDGVLYTSFLELEEKPRRILDIYKLRYTAFEPRIPHELVINSDGIDLTEIKII